MGFSRASGVLLHPTSLPGPGGIGSLGPAAHDFLESLSRCGQGVWQILPLGPPGAGNSPYQSFSAFAGNPLLVSGEVLVADGLLAEGELDSAPSGPEGRVDYGAVRATKARLVRTACAAFHQGKGDPALRQKYDAFRDTHGDWVHDYAIYRAIQADQGDVAWQDWPAGLAAREPGALEEAWRALGEEAECHRFAQFLFFEQWARIREHARGLGIDIFGDVPIFVSSNSADVWARREIFDLDEKGFPRKVAGVPPDYFSDTGQLWGNPLFRWDVLEERGYDWWVARMRASLELCDRVRIDHFRGFEAYWEVSAGETTAQSGHWVKGPGEKIFAKLREELGELPIVAEDLGVITEEVEALRDGLGFPGMAILQFGFGPDPKKDGFAPHNLRRNCVAYTGTHDNDTVVGWFHGGVGQSVRTEEEIEAERARVLRYTGTDGSEIHWDLIRLLLMSVADTAIMPMQDLLGLGRECRMNVPGRGDGNWVWRLESGQWTAEHMERLAELTRIYGRWTDPPSQKGEALP